jgi:hypothetical protein
MNQDRVFMMIAGTLIILSFFVDAIIDWILS